MFILGFGFVGQFLAADLKTKGWDLSGSCTSVLKKKKLEDLGFNQTYIFDANDPRSKILEVVKNHTHLVVSIPPLVGVGDPLLQHKELVETIFKDSSLKWIGYLSSTSVYGDHGGAWVDENVQVRPANEKAKARLAAELGWLNLGDNLGISAQVFRLGGIYGPGRSAVDTLFKKEPLTKGQKVRVSKNYTSRVHVADICQALHASILKPSKGYVKTPYTRKLIKCWRLYNCFSFRKIYNVVDDDPAPRTEVFTFAQKLVEEFFKNKLNLDPEKLESVAIEKSLRGEKRVSNARLKNELGVKLIHPTYRSGLQSIIENMDNNVWLP